MGTLSIRQIEGQHEVGRPGRAAGRTWFSLVISLAVLAVVLAACGGDADQPQNQADQGDNAADASTAVDKGTLEYGDKGEAELTDADEKHSYQFTGASGDQVLISINATGSAFTSPYVFLYGPDNALLANTDTSSRARSARMRHTLEADGTYKIVVQAVDGVGVAGYDVTVTKEG